MTGQDPTPLEDPTAEPVEPTLVDDATEVDQTPPADDTYLVDSGDPAHSTDTTEPITGATPDSGQRIRYNPS